MPVTPSRLRAPTPRLATVLVFVLACVVFFGYLWSQAGGIVPGISTNRAYTVSVQTDDVGNVVPFADVMVAGVAVGKVDALDREDGRITVVMSLDPVVTPVHEGVTVQISEKSLAGQPFVRLVDGTGAPVPNGQRLPDSAVRPPVTVRDVLASFDRPTLDALGGTVRSLGTATDGRTRDLAATFDGLADLGRHGGTAVDAIAAQSDDLQALSGELGQVFDALDTGEGQIARLVSSANSVTAATAGQEENLEAALRKLPTTLRGADATATQFDRISASLGPIAANLRRAAPDLDRALVQLPGTTADLRGLLPPLQGVLDKAPATLDRVPGLGSSARDLVPPATDLLRDLNPALRYLRPYGQDLSQLITNFGASFHHYGADGGSYVYLKPYFTPESVRPDPVALPEAAPLVTTKNPYPLPGGLADLRPFTGQFPRLERDD